ncbi:hypothetical protein GGI07_002795 [Coemansia sp. Benny D115]|nr:hypothetical protein GGI07_002795 [Coemansia sp. Benny D115]
MSDLETNVVALVAQRLSPSADHTQAVVPKIDMSDTWSVWVFHAVISEQEATQHAPVPSEFTVVNSGELAWRSLTSDASQQQQPGDSDTFQSDPVSEDAEALFKRALDNLIDCALLPLSIVRFGFRQWITLAPLPAQTRTQQIQGCSDHSAFSLPTPTTTPESLQHFPECADFIAASSLLDSPPASAPAPTSDTTHISNSAALEPTHLHLLRISCNISANSLLLQPSAQQISFLHPLPESIDTQHPAAIQQPIKAQSTVSASLPLLAIVRIAPYGLLAHVVSVPQSHLGESEDKSLDVWALAFGYPRDFLNLHRPGQSSMLWIRMGPDQDPLLYPRRLVLLDKSPTAQLSAKTALQQQQQQSSEAAAQEKISATDEKNASPDEASGTPQQHAMFVDEATCASTSHAPTTAAAPTNIDEAEEGEEGEEGEESEEAGEVTREECEEGEEIGEEASEEGEYDEEGEIADPVPAPATPETIPMAAELDIIIAELRMETSRSMEKSFAAIQESMAQFQSELDAEEKETRKREQQQKLEQQMKEKAAQQEAQAGATAAKLSKEKSAGGANGTKKRQRSNTKGEESGNTKARRKSVSTAKQQIPAVTTAAAAAAATATPTAADASNTPHPPSSDDGIALANGLDLNALGGSESTAAAVGDIGLLFGDGGLGDPGVDGLSGNVAGLGAADHTGGGDMGLGFGQLGDDMGLGMGLGDGLDVGMGDFSTTMFGVTDDDFNFFDSVPPPSAPPQAPVPKAEPGAGVLQSSLAVDPLGSAQTTSDMYNAATGDTAAVTSAVGIGIGSGAGMSDQPMQDNMDDLFDDGMFDSFFGGGPASAAPQENSSSMMDLSGSLAHDSVIDIKQEPVEPAQKIQSADPVSAGALSHSELTDGGSVKTEPHGIHALSSPPGVTGVMSVSEAHIGSVVDTSIPSVVGVELATPASLKMTPAPSTDLLTPTPAAQGSSSRPLDATAEFSSDVMSPGAAAQGPATMAIAHSSNAASSHHQTSAPTNSGTFNRSVTHASANRTKPGSAVRTTTSSMMPKPYSFVNTPFDDVGSASSSWLKDQPFPACMQFSSDNSSAQNPLDVLESGNSCPALVEKSLNPVSWIKRMSARRMQRAKASGINNSAGRGSRGSGRLNTALHSVRRLQGWLASYQAKSLYSGDFTPSFITSAKNTNASAAPDASSASHDHNIADAAEKADESADTCSGPSKLQGIHKDIAVKEEYSGNLQYSCAGNVQDELLAVSSIPSFTSIINPRKPPRGHTQMPGSLELSLNMDDLHAVAGSSSSFASSSKNTGLVSIVITKKKAIDASWVPQWLQAAGALADMFAGTGKVSPHVQMVWAPSIRSLLSIARLSLTTPADDSHEYQAEIPVLLGSSAMHGFLGGSTGLLEANRVENLGARIGGLLMLGSHSRQSKDHLHGYNKHSLPTDSGALGETASVADPMRSAVGLWLSKASQSDKWPEMLQMVADWAAFGPLLDFVSQSAREPGTSISISSSNESYMVTASVTNVLTSYWRGSGHSTDWNDAKDSMEVESIELLQQRHPESQDKSAAGTGAMSLGKLVALDSQTQSTMEKYRGFVVKKRRTVPPHASVSGSGSLASSACSGSVVLPSGPGTIEPLVDVQIVVGSYGQEDVALPSATQGFFTLKSRDAKSLYVKRWRHVQSLSSRAIHDAKVAAGEIEETEEGEEREDGEDMLQAEEDPRESIEGWPDPDSFATEAEDALRRVCIAASPLSLRWWSQMQMRPIGASKDIRWCAFVPPCPDASVLAAAEETPGASFSYTSVDGSDNRTDAAIREWCQAGSSVAEWYLGDVDSAYQAAHFGVHRPLGLSKVLDGVFTQLSEGAGSGGVSQSPATTSTAAGSAAATSAAGLSWTIQKPHQQQQQQQQQSTKGMAETDGQPSSALFSPTTLVLYMMVPCSSQMALWLAMAEASCIAKRAFEATLGSLIARTASGIPSSTTPTSSRVLWPSLVVHALPLDVLTQWHQGGRPPTVPSAFETALAVYNRCPEFLSAPPPLALFSAGSPAMGMGSLGFSAVGTSSAFRTMARQSNHAAGAAVAAAVQSAKPGGRGSVSEFLAAVLGRRLGNSSNQNKGISGRGGGGGGGGGGARGVGRASGMKLGVGQQQAGLCRRSGYFVYSATEHRQHHAQRSVGGMQGFAHRAFIISMPCTFPSMHGGGAVVPATLSVSRAWMRSDIAAGNSTGGGIGQRDAGLLPKTTSGVAVTGSLPGNNSGKGSSMPYSIPAVAAAMTQQPKPAPLSGSLDGASSNNQSAAVVRNVSRGEEESVSLDFDEVRVEFDLATQINTVRSPANASSSITAPPATAPAAAATTAGAVSEENGTMATPQSLVSKLVSHPLRVNDQTSTLHCIYTLIGRQSPTSPQHTWVAVCWCDETGEYVEHDVFIDDSSSDENGDSAAEPSTCTNNEPNGISAAAAGRIWVGCLRYQRLFGGNLRVVLGEWQGMSVQQSRVWQEYYKAWSQQQRQCVQQGNRRNIGGSVHMILVNIGINPPDGLYLSKSRTSDLCLANSTAAGVHVEGGMPIKPTSSNVDPSATPNTNSGNNAMAEAGGDPEASLDISGTLKMIPMPMQV